MRIPWTLWCPTVNPQNCENQMSIWMFLAFSSPGDLISRNYKHNKTTLRFTEYYRICVFDRVTTFGSDYFSRHRKEEWTNEKLRAEVVFFFAAKRISVYTLELVIILLRPVPPPHPPLPPPHSITLTFHGQQKCWDLSLWNSTFEPPGEKFPTSPPPKTKLPPAQQWIGGGGGCFRELSLDAFAFACI